MADIIDFPENEEAARERYRARQGLDKAGYDFGDALQEQLRCLQDRCGAGGPSLTLKINGQTLLTPLNAIFDALEERLLSGMSDLSVWDDPEVGTVAQVIDFERSIKPIKKPKTDALDVIRAELSPEERELRRIKRATMKAERQLVFDTHVAMLRAAYGEDAAMAYALLSRKAV